MTFTEAEILAQPELWARTLSIASGPGKALRGVLEGPVALVGAGSSYYVGLAAAAYLEERGFWKARAVPASTYRPRRQEAAVLISRSGTTTEAVEAAQAARAAGVFVGTVTCEPESPLTQLADAAVVLDFVQERSVVQTGSATSALLLLRALIDELAGRAPPVELPVELRRALATPLEAPDETAHMVVLGSGWRFGVACEAALKVQEMAQMWTERYPPLEYRHGPLSCAGAGTLVVVLDPPDRRIHRLAADIEATGARVMLARYDPLVELVRLQRLAVRMSLRRGLNPDAPRHLTRSVVLNGSDAGEEA